MKVKFLRDHQPPEWANFCWSPRWWRSCVFL